MSDGEETRTVRLSYEALDRIRLQRGWSLSELAKHSRISEKTLRRIRLGYPQYWSTLRDIATGLGIPDHNALRHEQSPPPTPHDCSVEGHSSQSPDCTPKHIAYALCLASSSARNANPNDPLQFTDAFIEGLGKTGIQLIDPSRHQYIETPHLGDVELRFFKPHPSRCALTLTMPSHLWLRFLSDAFHNTLQDITHYGHVEERVFGIVFGMDNDE